MTTFLDYPYDIALSYTMEDHPYANILAQILQDLGAKVYNDEYTEPFVGEQDLYNHLGNLYLNYAPYRVVLLSQNYLARVNIKLEVAQTLDLLVNPQYIIPVQLDNIDVSALLGPISCLDGHQKNADDIAHSIMKGLKKSPRESSTNVAQPTSISPGDPFKLKPKEQWLAEGEAHYNAGRYKEALKAFQEAINIDPTYAIAYHGKAKALDKLNRKNEALEALKHAHMLGYS